MRLALDPRARRLLRRLPRTTVYSVLELLLLSLLAMQCARLVWTFVTPLGPIGEWKTAAALRPVQPAGASLLGSFDPFFPATAGAAPAVVTTLNLQLFGVREDRASGRGSAIIGVADGTQRSFLIGEEIMPGVTLTAVGFDNVTVSRGGAPEQLFLDQSPTATVVGPGAPAPPNPAPSVSAPPPPLPVVVAPPPSPPSFNTLDPTGARFQTNTVQPQSSGNVLRAAGFQPGDVLVGVGENGSGSAEEASAELKQMLDLAAQVKGELNTVVLVERNGRRVKLRVGTDR